MRVAHSVTVAKIVIYSNLPPVKAKPGRDILRLQPASSSTYLMRDLLTTIVQLISQSAGESKEEMTNDNNLNLNLDIDFNI